MRVSSSIIRAMLTNSRSQKPPSSTRRSPSTKSITRNVARGRLTARSTHFTRQSSHPVEGPGRNGRNRKHQASAREPPSRAHPGGDYALATPASARNNPVSRPAAKAPGDSKLRKPPMSQYSTGGLTSRPYRGPPELCQAFLSAASGALEYPVRNIRRNSS